MTIQTFWNNKLFPSPCGVWVVSGTRQHLSRGRSVSVPLRGVGCFRVRRKAWTSKRFPSPCGVWVVSAPTQYNVIVDEFPSPCGVWVVSRLFPKSCRPGCFRPLAGCGLFPEILQSRSGFFRSFRPLAGCGLFPVGSKTDLERLRFRPLAGCGLFRHADAPLGGDWEFPSPCGVWVVSLIKKRRAFEFCFRPLAGCGLFRQSCTFFLVQQEKELSTLLFYCIILADVYQ